MLELKGSFLTKILTDHEELLEMELFGDEGESVLEDEDFAMLRELEEAAGEADDDFLKMLLEDDE